MAKKQKIDENGTAAEGGEHIMYLKNLSWQVTEADIKDYFSSCGAIAKIEVGEFAAVETENCLIPRKLFRSAIDLLTFYIAFLSLEQ